MVKNGIYLSVFLLSLFMTNNLKAEELNANGGSEGKTQIQIEDEMIQDIGRTSMPAYIAGGVLGAGMGFGIGHAIQSRFTEKGYIFLTGELLATTAMVGMFSDCAFSLGSRCRSDSSQIGAVWLFVGLRIWEAIDLWYTPISINRRLEELNSNKAVPKIGITPGPQGPNLVVSWDL